MLDCALEDLAYLLGLICGRGKLDYDTKNIILRFPFRLSKITNSENVISQRDRMIVDLNYVVHKLSNLTERVIQIVENKSNIELSIDLQSCPGTWQMIVRFLGNKVDFHGFSFPNEVYDTPKAFKETFIRGMGDVAGFITKGNADQQGRHRVYLEIPNANWLLPAQVCNLLQDKDINIPVQTITWGHPNIRGDMNWKKEHQVKIYAEYYEAIGFTIKYKQEILEECALLNKQKFNYHDAKYCDPIIKSKNGKGRIKKHNQDEMSDGLPDSIKGKHFNSFWEICCNMGCNRCHKEV